MRASMKKRTIAAIIISILAIIIYVAINNISSSNDNQTIRGKVLKVIQTTNTNAKGSNKSTMTQNMVSVQILNGPHKGQIINVDNLVNDKTSHEAFAKKGDSVLLNITENDNGTIKSAYIYELVRYYDIYALIILFVILLSVIGGKKGVKSIVGLAITGIVILKVLLPLILAGYNPITVSLILCIGVSILNLLIISGRNKKTYAAIIGTVGGVLIAAAIAYYFSTVLRLTGLSDDELQMLVYISQNQSFDFRGLLFSGILMGALGAVMDISMSIASAVNEINENSEEISFKELIRAGMNVGRDIMGTMANTLILAYVGGSMYTFMLVSSYNLSINRMIDQDLIASEILKALAGSIGLVFTIPITAIATAWLIKNFKPKKEKAEERIIDKL
jgi:uncharacterized membrane protein